MSWTLFLQICLLMVLLFILLVGLAGAFKSSGSTEAIYVPSTQPMIEFPHKPMSYYSGTRPVSAREGDYWINPWKGNEVKVWEESRQDWVDLPSM